MIAAVCTWHEHFSRASGELDRRLNAGELLVAAAPALVETYSVLTRLPTPRRLSPGAARTLLQSNFMRDSTNLVTLDANDYRRLIDSAPARGIAGGRIYVAVILACAVSARVDVLLTFNARDFASLSLPGIEIVVPG